MTQVPLGRLERDDKAEQWLVARDIGTKEILARMKSCAIENIHVVPNSHISFSIRFQHRREQVRLDLQAQDDQKSVVFCVMRAHSVR